jgi:hypothetical protein
MVDVNTIVSGQPAAGFTLIFKPASGELTTSIPFHSLLEIGKVPSDKAGTSKYKPASGTGAGHEDFVVASDEVSEPTVKALFDADYYSTLLSIRRQPGTFNLVFAEASAMTGRGVMTEAVVNALNADDEMTVTMSFALAAGQTFYPDTTLVATGVTTPANAGAFTQGGLETAADGTTHPWWVNPNGHSEVGAACAVYLRYLDSETWRITAAPPPGLPHSEMIPADLFRKAGGAGDNVTGMLGVYAPNLEDVTGNLTVATATLVASGSVTPDVTGKFEYVGMYDAGDGSGPHPSFRNAAAIGGAGAYLWCLGKYESSSNVTWKVNRWGPAGMPSGSVGVDACWLLQNVADGPTSMLGAYTPLESSGDLTMSQG